MNGSLGSELELRRGMYEHDNSANGLRHGHGCIPFRASLITTAPLITIVTSVNCRRQCDVPPPERCDMSPRPRIASTIGGVDDRYRTQRCDRRRATGDRRAVQGAPPRQPNLLRSKPSRPRSLPDRAVQPTDRAQARRLERRAPLPKLGLLPRASSTRSLASTLRAGATASRGEPSPNRPARHEPPPNAAQQAPAAAQPQPPPRRARQPAWDIDRRMGHRTGQPERDHPTFRHHRNRPRDHVGQRRSRQPSGAHGVRRHLRLLRRSRQAMAVQRAVPQPRRGAVQDDHRARWRGRQPVFRLTAYGAGHLQADHQQHQAGANETGIIPTAGIAVGRNQYLNFMSIRNWDSPGAWTTNFSAIAVSPDNGETWGVYPGTVRTPARTLPSPLLAGNENFQMGAFLKPGPGDPYIYSFGTPSGRGGSAYVARVPPGFIPDLTKYEYWNSDKQTLGSQPIRRPRRR